MLVGQQIGPFLIDKELGSGAMGTVYRGIYSQTGVRVAVKIMAPGLGSTNANAVDRFEREAVILKQLKHPNIVRLFGVGKTHGMRYYAMEYIEGESLDKSMARRQRLTWEEVVVLGQQLCAALQHAHEKGVIHRDLKPSNLMIAKDGTLKLTDFGIAKDMDNTALTSANCTVGTASYMSPEQCRGERDLTHKSDLYSLGIVFYELLTSRKPFNAENAMDMFLLHVSGTFERPSRLVLDLPVWFDTLICQLLEKKPEDRPLDAAMVAAALNTIQEKVEAQLSAGVDAERTRKVDRPRGARTLDETDREAARTLKSGKRKLKRKGKQTRFYERAWFVIVGLLALLLAMGTVCYFVFWASTPVDRLYVQAKRLVETNDPEKWDEALDGPLKEFEAGHGNDTGAKADQLRRWAVEGHLRQCNDKVKNHLDKTSRGKAYPPSNPEEEIAFPAAVAENAGNFDEALQKWEKLQQTAGAAPWGVYAAYRVRELKKIDTEEQRLQKQLDKIREFRHELDPETPDLDLLTALRYERFGDAVLAAQRFEQLRTKYAADPNRHLAYLLAARKVKDLKPKIAGVDDPVALRENLLRQRLKDVAEERKADNLGRAYELCLHIIALYNDLPETTTKKLVSEARQARDELRKELRMPESPDS